MRYSLLVVLIVSSLHAQQDPDHGMIIGRVSNAATHEPIVSANIVIYGSTMGASTNGMGEFSIQRVPPGTYEVMVSALGYASSTHRNVVVIASQNREIEFMLVEQSIPMNDVFTIGTLSLNAADVPLSTRWLSFKEIQNTAGGFDDIIRTVTIMPGVMQTRLDRNDLSVRGGAASENLFVVDDIEFANVNHFGTQGSGGGSVSFINLDFIENTTFSSGGFGVRYGDRLSSMLSVGIRDGREDMHRRKVMLSATEAGVNLEGPLSEQGSYLFSARRSFLDPLFRLYGFSFAPYYYDFLVKTNYRIGRYDKLEFLSIGAIDRNTLFNDTQQQRDQNNHTIFSDQTRITGGLIWHHGFDIGYMTLTGWHSYADIRYHQTGDRINPFFLNSSYEGETAVKGDATIQIFPSTECDLGVGIKTARLNSTLSVDSFNSGFIEAGEEIQVAALHLASDTSGYKMHGYVQLSQILDPLVLACGLRWDYFSMIRQNSVVSPRVSARLQILPMTTLTLSVGRFYQSPSYIWIIGNSYNRALTFLATNQYVVGVEHYFRSDVKMSVEGYIKNYDHYPLSLTQPFMVMVNSGAEVQSINEAYETFGLDYLESSGTGQARGIEFFLQKQFSETPLYGRVSVSLSEARFTALDGVSRPSSTDQRWKVNLSAGYIYDENWEFNATFRYSSGIPYTPFTNHLFARLSSEYNTVRTDANHSLDIRANRRWVMTSWILNTYIDIQNIYNRKPSEPPYWDQQKSQVAEQNLLGVVPSIGISVEF